MQLLLLWLSMLWVPSPGLEINTASLESLIRIGIPPVHAQQIISIRKEAGPFHEPADLLEIDGIEQLSFARVSASLSVNGLPLPKVRTPTRSNPDSNRLSTVRSVSRDGREASRNALRNAERSQ